MKLKSFSITLVSAALLMSGTVAANAFTIVNHATVAHIAQRHMTPKALANYNKAFDNHPLAEFASYPDFFRAIYLVDGRTITHSVHLDKDLNPLTTREDGCLNAYGGMLRAIEQLEDYRHLDDSTKVTAIALLVHFMGDSHCPGHLVYPDGRQKIKHIYYRAYPKNSNVEPKEIGYHEFWDSWCTDRRYSQSFADRTILFDTCTPEQIRKIQEGTPADWMHASAVACKDTYDVRDGQIVDRVYITRKADLAASQVRDAGYRLAAILNRIFGK